jgi:hypothetical protein
MTEAKSQIREELKNLDRLALQLERVYGPDCTAQMILTLGAGRLLENGATPAGVAGAFRLLAAQIEEAHGVPSLGQVFALATKGARAQAGANAGKQKRFAKGAATRADVLLLDAKLRSEGVARHKRTQKIAETLRLSVDTVRHYRK